ncbi:MAG: choice-of-anchor B family protein [Bacteroidota bacterium]
MPRTIFLLFVLLGSTAVLAQPDPALTEAPQAAAWRAAMGHAEAPGPSAAGRTTEDFNMTLLGTLGPATDRYGDIWGWVDPATNREYALLTGRDNGLFVIDVTDDAPVQTGFVPGLASSGGSLDAKDVKTYGSYAYLVNERAPLQIIDLADPTDPVQVGTLDVQPGVSSGGSHNILVKGDYLYVIGGRSPGGLRIYSLADPAAPAFAGGIAGTDGQTYYHDIDIVGEVLYAAAIYDQGIDILDISDKANPTVTANFQYAAVNQGAHNICATEDGSHLFVGDEIGSERHTRGFDVRDPFDVEQVSTIIINPNPSQPVHNCYVRDDLLYIAAYADGVRVYDVSDPGDPEAVGAYDTYLGTETGFRGAWTIYPYLPSGKLIVSDKDTGLYVLRLGEPPVDAEDDAQPADVFALGASYPNPTTGAMTVPFALGEAAHVRLAVYDVLGREVAVLADGLMAAGDHAILFDGDALPNGAYVARLDVAGSVQTRPFTLLR